MSEIALQMLSNLIYVIEDLYRTHDNINYHRGNKELELRFTLPKWLDKTRLLNMYNYDIDKYTEYIYNSNDINRSKIRVRDYGNKRESIIKYNIIKRRDHILDIDIVLSYENNILSNPQYPPYKTIICTRYIKQLGNITIDIKVVDQTIRLEIEINNNNYIEDLKLAISTISNAIYNSDNIISAKIYRVLLDIYNNYIVKCPLPRHINTKKLGKLVGPWIVTQKLDGERRFLCIISYGIYSINRSGRIYMISDKYMDIKHQSIIDCEFYNNIYYIIDCIMVSSHIVVNINYLDRLRTLRSLKVLDRLSVASKQCYIVNNIMLRDIVYNTMCSNIYDGIILVNPMSRYHDTQYKIKKVPTCDMWFDGKYLLSSDNVRYNPKTTDGLIVGTIYECQYESESSKWIVIKSRLDKNNANYSKVILEIIDSITLDNLYNYRYSIMASYHNIVKKIILSTHKSNGILLDIGTGRGGDISKWRKYKKVYCIEPSTEGIEEIIRRMTNKHINTNIILIQCKLSNYDKISTTIKDKITNITMFFSIMMMEQDDLLSLSNIINNICDINCSIDIITTSRELIEPVIGTECVTRYDNNRVLVTIPNTYIKDNKEYLIDISHIDSITSKHGFTTRFNTKIYPHHMMIVPDIDIAHTYIYIGYDRGNCRNNNIRNTDNDLVYRNILIKYHGSYYISYNKANYNILVNNNIKYYCDDIKYSVIF